METVRDRGEIKNLMFMTWKKRTSRCGFFTHNRPRNYNQQITIDTHVCDKFKVLHAENWLIYIEANRAE